MKRYIPLCVGLFAVFTSAVIHAQSTIAPFGYHPDSNFPLCPPSSDYKWSDVPAYGGWTNSNNYNNYDGDYFDCVAQQPGSTSSPPATTSLAGDVFRRNISSDSVDSNHIMISWGALSNNGDAAVNVDFYRSGNWHTIAANKWGNSGWINQDRLCSSGCDNGSLGGQTNVTLYRLTSPVSGAGNVVDYRLINHDTRLSSGIDDSPVTAPVVGSSEFSRLHISSGFEDSNHVMISWGTLSNNDDAVVNVDFYESDNWHTIAENKWGNSGWINQNRFCSTGCDNGSLGGQTNVTLYRLTSTDSGGGNVIDYRILNHVTGLSSGIDETPDTMATALPRNPNVVFRNNQNTPYSNASFNHGDTISGHGATYTSLIDVVPESQSYSDHDYARGASKGDGNFRVSCQWSHFAQDDPIVAYNNFGGSHLHMYFGNTMADASSTKQSLINRGGGLSLIHI